MGRRSFVQTSGFSLLIVPIMIYEWCRAVEPFVKVPRARSSRCLHYTYLRTSRLLPSPVHLERYVKLHPLPDEQGAKRHVRRCPNLRGPTLTGRGVDRSGSSSGS